MRIFVVRSLLGLMCSELRRSPEGIAFLRTCHRYLNYPVYDTLRIFPFHNELASVHTKFGDDIE